jgi:hypothetical protein
LAVFLAVLFLAVDFFAVDFFAGDDFLAVVFFAGEDFFAVDFFAGEDFLAVDFFAGEDFLAVDVFLADAELDFFAGDDELFFAVVFFAVPPVAERAVLVAADSVSFGSFLAPDTTFFRSAPGLNFGMAVFFALIRSPVRGLRTHRASRTRFSKDPKPVMATFSPFATSRVMVSSTESSACWACLRLPSYRAARLSIS